VQLFLTIFDNVCSYWNLVYGHSIAIFLRSLSTACHQVTRTWRRGNNADFLGRVAKLAVRRKWASLIAAFRTALRKVRQRLGIVTSIDTQHMHDVLCS
jgi:hypothetical protein